MAGVPKCLAGLLGVHTALESPSTIAAPSLTRVRVQLNLVFPDLTEVLTVSDMARTLCRAERKMQREAVEHKPILSQLLEGTEFQLLIKVLIVESEHLLIRCS